MESNDALYKVKPTFNIIYEMFMPTGRKLRNTILALIIMLVCYILIAFALNDPRILNSDLMKKSNTNIFATFSNVALIIIGIVAVKLTVNIVMHILQYKSIQYTFYDDYLEYEDTFLNQHKKTVRYDNVREIEIRRTVWDRINGYGVIIIYSNAEKASNNGLILYSIKDPQKTYDIIDKLIHTKLSVRRENSDNESASNRVMESDNISNRVIESENSFKDSLNNKE